MHRAIQFHSFTTVNLQFLSIHTDIPIPPPTHRAATPFLPPVLSKACNNVTRILAPEAPMGCPNAIAPPFIFTCYKDA